MHMILPLLPSGNFAHKQGYIFVRKYTVYSISYYITACYPVHERVPCHYHPI